MTAPFTLHHYEASPYAEKIRLMLGLCDAEWSSLTHPVWPPRPDLDPLTGGYRRIPVAQIGADIFCDSALIATEIAARFERPELDPLQVDERQTELMNLAQQQAFFAGLASLSPLRLLTTMLLKFGPMGMVTFMKDRKSLVSGGTHRGVRKAAATTIYNDFLQALEDALQSQPWIGGDQPSVADFSCYHPIWLRLNISRSKLKAGPATMAWFNAVAKVGYGQRKELSAEQVFAIAGDATPRELPASVADSPVDIGVQVSVAPSDYGVVPVNGRLAAVTEDRIVVARETAQFGVLHVHFPRAGFAITAI